MKVEEIKLHFQKLNQYRVELFNNVSELKALEKNIQSEYNALPDTGRLMNDLNKFNDKTKILLDKMIDAEIKVEDFISKVKKLGIDPPKEVYNTLSGLDMGQKNIKIMRDLITSSAKQL